MKIIHPPTVSGQVEEFVSDKTAVQLEHFIAFAKQFDFSAYRTHCDMGGASDLSIQIVTYNSHMQSLSFALPQVVPLAQHNIDKHPLKDCAQVVDGNFFTDVFPEADIITIGSMLYNWNNEAKKMLITKAHKALPSGGALAVIQNVINNERKENDFACRMPLHMQMETYDGFNYTAADFITWVIEAGFTQVE